MKKYQNPVNYVDGKKHTNPDPYVLRWCGNYYCYSSDAKGVNISISEDLIHWEYKGYALQDEEYQQYWAPSVLYWCGKFYMYYSNIPKTEEDCHYEWLKVAVADKPEGPFTYVKTFFDEFSIDSHPYIRNGQLYMFYSVNNWYGTEEKIAGTCILVDKMITPLEFAGIPELVVAPSLEREIYEKNRFGDGRDWHTIEGACTVDRNGKNYVLYSANAYENVDYFVGTAIANLREDVLQMEWKKYPNDYTWNPLIRKNEYVEGTGHNTVAKAPNLVDDWIVYHGRNAEDKLIKGTEQRVMRIDPLYYNADEMLCFGPSHGEMPAPEEASFQIKNLEIQDQKFFTETDMYYVAEWWIQAAKQHTGIKYGILLSYQDEMNYVEAVISSGRRTLEIFAHDANVVYSLGKISLPVEFDYTVPHKIMVERSFETYRVEMEDRVKLEVTYGNLKGKTKVGVNTCFSKLFICSMSLTASVNLLGKDLKYLTGFYDIIPQTYLEDGIRAESGTIILRGKKFDPCYTEEFQVELERNENMIFYFYGDTKIAEGINFKDRCSMIHIVRENEEIFLIDGELQTLKIQEMDCDRNKCEILFKGLKITNYRYTKN